MSLFPQTHPSWLSQIAPVLLTLTVCAVLFSLSEWLATAHIPLAKFMHTDVFDVCRYRSLTEIPMIPRYYGLYTIGFAVLWFVSCSIVWFTHVVVTPLHLSVRLLACLGLYLAIDDFYGLHEWVNAQLKPRPYILFRYFRGEELMVISYILLALSVVIVGWKRFWADGRTLFLVFSACFMAVSLTIDLRYSHDFTNSWQGHAIEEYAKYSGICLWAVYLLLQCKDAVNHRLATLR